MFPIIELHNALAAVCPIQGVAVADPADRSTWRVDFDPSATATQQAAAQSALAAFTPKAILPSDQFFGRFMALGVTGAVWAACARDPTGQLGAGLTHGLAGGAIDLSSAETQQWMAGLVAAGAITQDQSNAILTP